MNRVRQAEKPGLPAVAIEIDLGGEAAPRGRHGRLLAGNRAATDGIGPVCRPYIAQPRKSTAPVGRPGHSDNPARVTARFSGVRADAAVLQRLGLLLEFLGPLPE